MYIDRLIFSRNFNLKLGFKLKSLSTVFNYCSFIPLFFVFSSPLTYLLIFSTWCECEWYETGAFIVRPVLFLYRALDLVWLEYCTVYQGELRGGPKTRKPRKSRKSRKFRTFRKRPNYENKNSTMLEFVGNQQTWSISTCRLI